MYVDPTQSGSLSSLTAKKTMAGPARPAAPPTVDRAPATEAANRPSTLPLPTTAAAPTTLPTAPTVPPTFGGPETLSVDGLLEARGQADKRYDLDGSGAVDMMDLMKLLSDLSPERPVNEGDLVSYPLATDVRSAGAPADDDADAPTDVASTRTDFTGMTPAATFGAVSAAPPVEPAPRTQFTAPTVAETVRETSVAPAPTPAPTVPTTQADQLVQDMAEAKTRFLLAQLERSGFAQRPPLNIHELVDSLDFSANEREGVIDRLETRYPHGLGLDTLA